MIMIAIGKPKKAKKVCQSALWEEIRKQNPLDPKTKKLKYAWWWWNSN